MRQNSLRDDTEELDVRQPQNSPELTLPHGGNRPKHSFYNGSTSQTSHTPPTDARTPRSLREHSSRHPRIEISEDNEIAANDFADSRLFSSSRIWNTQIVMGRGKQRNPQGDSTVDRTAETLRINSLQNSNMRDWHIRLEPCIAAAQREYDDVAAVYEIAKDAYITSMKSGDDALRSVCTASTSSPRLSIEAIESDTPGSLIQKLNEMDAMEEKHDQLRITYQRRKESRIAHAKVFVKLKSSMEKKEGLLKQLQSIMNDLMTDGGDEAEWEMHDRVNLQYSISPTSIRRVELIKVQGQ